METQINEEVKKSEIVAKERGVVLNPDKEAVKRIAQGLLLNQEKHGEGYCPCRRVTGDKENDKKIICPCVFMAEEIERDGHCLCGLFWRG